jgi:hypothetical protein
MRRTPPSGRRPSPVPLLALLTGCATAPPAPPPPPSPAAAPAAPAPAHDESFGIRATPLAGGGDLARLCGRLASEDDVSFAGNEVEQARAREAHRARRLEEANARYAIELPAGRFTFARYELGTRRLHVDGARFSLGEGAEIYAADPEQRIAFELPEDAATALLDEHAAGRLRLRLLLRPARSPVRDGHCVRLGGGIAKLGAQILAAQLVGPGGAPRARAESDEVAEAVGAARPVEAPLVVVGAPSSNDKREVPAELGAAARALAPELLACYREALTKRPRTRGALVVGARVASDGRLEAPHMEMSSVDDDALVACVVARLGKAKLAPIGAPLRVSIPISFGSETERATRL